MKKRYFAPRSRFSYLRLITVLFSSLLVLRAGQVSAPRGGYQIIARGPNSRVWQKTLIQTNTLGVVTTNIQSYTELASGLCYRDPTSGQYIDTVEQIDLTATGAQAVQGAHQVVWEANANTASGAVQLTTPDGQTFKSRVFGLSYWDSANGTNVLIGELKDSTGSVVGSNEVVYPDAFTGVKADISYTYTKAGLEQNIILREQLPSPSDYGLNVDSTRLEVLTEFFSPPIPQNVYSVQTNGITDNLVIGFGTMYIGIGKAFLAGAGDSSILAGSVSKEWTTLQGRDFLIEEVPFSMISSLETNLPLHASASKPAKHISRTAALQMPPRAKPKASPSPMRVAKSDFKTAGLMANSGTNLTFQSDTTYYVSGNVSLSGTNIFEGGTVIKYAPGCGMGLVPGPLLPQTEFLTGPYRPVVFSARDDDSVGTIISGSSGNPRTNYYANPALDLDSAGFTIENVRFSYAMQGIEIYPGRLAIVNAQFVCCSNAVAASAASVSVENGLFASVLTPLNAVGTGTTITGNNITFSDSSYLVSFVATNAFALNFTNCIFSQVTNLFGYPSSSPSSFSYSPNANYNGFYNTPSFGGNSFPNSSYPFEAIGAASYYLATNSQCRGVGTTNIDATLLADLQTLTTYPPVYLTNWWVTNDCIFSPQVTRDANTTLDLGYHYDPLDYAISFELANATATVLPGTALAVCGAEYGIWLYSNGVMNCTGTATSPNYFVEYNTVQEQSNTNWERVPGLSILYAPYWIDGSSANFVFTEWSILGGTDYHISSSGVPCPLSFQSCRFYDGILSDLSGNVSSTNSLYKRVRINIRDPSSTPSDSFLNNLFLDGSLTFRHLESSTWTFSDNLFDSTDITNIASSVINVCNNNAYVTTNYMLGNDYNPVILASSPTYETGILGQYYYPTGYLLINAGSRLASAAGLYYYTVTTNNVIDGTNLVSIGFHYVAVGTNGLPLDLDNDGIPDYLEYPATSSDGYGTPDSWYWMAGLNPGAPGIGSADQDGDGLLNYQEYLYGTSPLISEGFALWVAEPSGTSMIP